MEPICSECEYDYRALRPSEAGSVLRREADTFAAAISTREPVPAIPEGSWSAIEYAGHVRDVLIVARERTLTARIDDNAAAVPMGRDERVTWGEYDGLSPTRAAAEVRQAADWLAHSWDLLPDAAWNRTLLYNYPERRPRPLAWLAAHIVHELVHHRLDVERLTYDAVP